MVANSHNTAHFIRVPIERDGSVSGLRGGTRNAKYRDTTLYGTVSFLRFTGRSGRLKGLAIVWASFHISSLAHGESGVKGKLRISF